MCVDLSDPTTAEREFRALEEAAGQWPHATRRVLTLTDRDPAIAPPDGVDVQPAYAWMLK